MSQPGDQDFQSTAAVPAVDAAPGVQAWDTAGPAPTERYPMAPPAYPTAQFPQPGMVYPQPGMPYVPPGAPQPVGYGYPYPVREAPMCGLAVASLVCGIVWVYWITSILAIVFGAVALGKIKREGLRGRGLAIAGLVLGIVWMALMVFAVIGAVVGGTSALIPFAG